MASVLSRERKKGGDAADVDDSVSIRRRLVERLAGVWTIRIVTLAAVLGAWELYGWNQNPALFAPFSRVAQSFYELAIASNVLWVAMWNSLQALLIGYALAVGVGLVVGVLMGRYRAIEYVLDPYVSFFYVLPMIVLVPLMIIWMGIGPTIRIAIVFFIAVWPMIINTMAGAKEVSADLLDVAKTHCATEGQTVRSIVVPSALPYVFTGLYVAIGSAMIGMVLGEILVVLQGLGGLLVHGAHAYQPEKVLVALLAIMAESLLLSGGILWLRRKLMPWA